MHFLQCGLYLHIYIYVIYIWPSILSNIGFIYTLYIYIYIFKHKQKIFLCEWEMLLTLYCKVPSSVWSFCLLLYNIYNIVALYTTLWFKSMTLCSALIMIKMITNARMESFWLDHLMMMMMMMAVVVGIVYCCKFLE